MFSEIVMRILVMIMMFGMGMALTSDDLRRLFKLPNSIFRSSKILFGSYLADELRFVPYESV